MLDLFGPRISLLMFNQYFIFILAEGTYLWSSVRNYSKLKYIHRMTKLWALWWQRG